MSDVSDNLIENDDLLDILKGSSEELSDVEKAMESTNDEEDISKRLDEIRALTNTVVDSEVASNPGSGDLDTDLDNWFNGTDSIPSDKLNEYVSNVNLKMDYGLTRQTLSNMSIMGRMHRFLESSLDLLTDDSTLMSMSPDELESRTKMVFTMYKELATLNQRTVMSLKDYRLKSGDGTDEIDKITMLLSSIPSDKLKSALDSITKSSK